MSELSINGHKIIDMGDVIQGTQQTISATANTWNNNLTYSITLEKGTYIAMARAVGGTGSAGGIFIRLQDGLGYPREMMSAYSPNLANIATGGTDVIKLDTDVTQIKVDGYITGGNVIYLTLTFYKIE